MFGRIIAWTMAILTTLGVITGVGAAALVQHYMQDLPDYTTLEAYEPPVVTRLHANDGQVMTTYAVENRIFTPIQAIPPHVRQAFVSAEDQAFYQHNGLDYVGIARAVIDNIGNMISGRRVVGGSTITQQVAENFFLSNEVSLTLKLREALLAIRIEEAFSKDRILELYLNQIYLGRGAYGVGAAAQIYFDTPVTELTLPQAAFLAALPKGPSNYDPVRYPEAALARRAYVLGRMLDDGEITQAEYDAASATPIEVVDRRTRDTVEADYFAEEVRRELLRLYGFDELYEGGLTVHTTMDPRLQQIARQVLRAGLESYDLRHGYRGPVARMESFDGWPQQLADMEPPAGAHEGWELAVVLEVAETDADRAILGFADRRRGLVTLGGVEWARPWLDGQRVGQAPNSVDDALALGDVVLVERIGPAPDGLSALFEGEEVAEGAAPPQADVYALRQVPEIQGALVAMDPHTGDVLAMVGGYDFEASEFNRATQAARQPGSAIKPFVYLAALNAGYTPATIVLDIPLAIEQEGQADYRPQNYGGGQLGPVPMFIGIERSRNLMTVRILQELGLEPVAEITQRYGVYDDMPLLYSMALGAGEATPMALTNAYAMIANGGRRIEPTLIERIQDRRGDTLLTRTAAACDGCGQTDWRDGLSAPTVVDDRELINDPATTYQLINMMQGVTSRGTAGRLAALGLPLAGKTGTTNDSYDAWFVGFVPNLAVGVFVGFDTPRSLGDGETGGSVAAPIFGEFMERAMEGMDPGAYDVPEGLEMVAIDPDTGFLAGPGSGSVVQAFRPGTAPGETAAEAAAGPVTSFGESVDRSTQGTGGLY